MIEHPNQKGGSKEIWELDLYWKSPPVFSTSNMELKFELSPWTKTILILGLEFPMERSNTWSILLRTIQKFLQIHKKSKFHKQARVWLQPGQKQKQNLNRVNSLGRQQPYQYTKEDGLTLNHQNKILTRTISRRKSFIFFDTIRRYTREEDGAIEFCKIKFHLRNHHSQIQNWSDDRWKACLAAGGGSKRRYQYCSDNSGTIIYLRALQGHAGSNLIDPTLQDNVMISVSLWVARLLLLPLPVLHSLFLSFLSMLSDNFDSVTNNLRNSANGPSSPPTIPSRSQKSEMRAYMSPPPPPKISLRHDWTRGEVPLGSTVDQQPEGGVVRQSRGEVSRQAKISQPTQPIPKPICDPSGQPDNTQYVFVVKGEMSRSQEIDVKSFHEELCSSDRSGQPDITPSVIGAQLSVWRNPSWANSRSIRATW